MCPQTNSIIEPTDEEHAIYLESATDTGQQEILSLLNISPTDLTDDQIAGVSAAMHQLALVAAQEQLTAVLDKLSAVPHAFSAAEIVLMLAGAHQALTPAADHVGGHFEFYYSQELERRAGVPHAS
ncbi:hypothetical protein VVR12_03220 [Rothia sp. LK2588]|uniref:hypothetical protein n=1 Tax=Rothia sp. LK2588 TaxID=3114369 RepID=UPI0034CFD294